MPPLTPGQYAKETEAATQAVEAALKVLNKAIESINERTALAFETFAKAQDKAVALYDEVLRKTGDVAKATDAWQKAVDKAGDSFDKSLRKIKPVSQDFLDNLTKAQARLEALQAPLLKFQVALGRVGEAFALLTAGAARMGAALQQALGPARTTLAGFVAAGLAASALGEVLGFRMERLALSIAGLFRPEIEKVIGLVERFTGWLQSLSDAQRTNLAHWLEAGAAALVVARVLPLVFGGVQVLIGGIRTLTAAFLAFDVASGGILPLLGALVTGAVALGAGAVVAEDGLGGLFQALQPLLDTLKEVGAEVFEALKPLFPVFQEAFAAFIPVLQEVAKLFGSLALVFAPVLEILVSGVTILFEALAGLLGLLNVLVRVIIAVVIPPLKILAATLQLIAKAIAFITGTKLGLEVPKKEEEKPGSRTALADRRVNIGAVDQVYTRIAALSLKAGTGIKDPAAETAQNTARLLEEARRTNQQLGNFDGVVKRN